LKVNWIYYNVHGLYTSVVADSNLKLKQLSRMLKPNVVISHMSVYSYCAR